MKKYEYLDIFSLNFPHKKITSCEVTFLLTKEINNERYLNLQLVKKENSVLVTKNMILSKVGQLIPTNIF